MITLTISRDSLDVPSLPLTISDSGTGTYVLVSLNPGAKQRENSIAESRWLDGGQLTSTRTGIVMLDLAVRINATGAQALINAAETLDEALNQYAYTLTQTVASSITTTVYDCMPASTSFPYDPVAFRGNTALFTASIPRQP